MSRTSLRLSGVVVAALIIGIGMAGIARAANPILEGDWPLQETSGTTVNDVSGNGCMGTMNVAVPSQSGGMFGNYYNFTGTQCATIPSAYDTYLTGMANVTLSAWIKLPGSSFSSDASLLSNWTDRPDQFRRHGDGL